MRKWLRGHGQSAAWSLSVLGLFPPRSQPQVLSGALVPVLVTAPLRAGPTICSSQHGVGSMYDKGDLGGLPPVGPLYLLQGTGQNSTVPVVLGGPRHSVRLASSRLPVAHDGACKHFKTHLSDIQETVLSTASTHARSQPGPGSEGC